MSTSTHNRWMIVMVLILVSAMAQMVSAETAHVANHVVISEFATRGSGSASDEFVELYNPTSSAINIGGWKLRYWSGSSWGDELTIPDGETIPSHSFYLMASKDYASSTEPDQRKDTNFGFADGSTSSPRGIRIIDSSSTVVDTVVYGGAGGADDPSGQAEGGKLAPNHGTTTNDNSVERKAIASSEESDMAPSGAHHLWGNGEDTDNNGNDFVRQTNGREPQNSTSDPENCPAQSWFLSNVSSSSYIMYKEDMSKPEGTVTISDGSSEIWGADEAATVDVGFPEGTWSGTLNLDTAFASGNSFTAEVGSYDGSDFTARGSQTISGDGSTIYPLSIPASAFTVPETEYLALQVNPSGADFKVKTGGGNSYVISPETDPGYPVPELPTIILVSAGLLILVGYVYVGRRSK